VKEQAWIGTSEMEAVVVKEGHGSTTGVVGEDVEGDGEDKKMESELKPKVSLP